MALLPYRTEVGNGAFVTVDNFMNGTGEAGTLVVHTTTTSGVGSSFDNSNALVRIPTVANGSGERPAGVLLLDVVNKDLSQTHLNVYKRETQVGGKVALLKRGTIVTNLITAAQFPTAGDPAYFTAGGAFDLTSPTGLYNVAAGLPGAPVSTRVGTFVGGKNSDGFVKIDINIP